jgi:hypothetical protein
MFFANLPLHALPPRIFQADKIENDFNFSPQKAYIPLFRKANLEKLRVKTPKFPTIRKSIDRASGFCEPRISQKRFQF